jgi:proteasome regulatory subunit
MLEIHRTLAQLLAELDGFDPLDDVKVIATTNRIDVLKSREATAVKET